MKGRSIVMGAYSSSTKSTGEVSTQTVVILESLFIPSISPQNIQLTNFSLLLHKPLKTLTLIPILYFRFLRERTNCRKLFNRDVIRYYELQKGLCTDGAGNTIMCYSLGEQLSPEDIPPFLDQSIEVCEMFQRAGHPISAT